MQRYAYELVRVLDLLLTNGSINSEDTEVELLAPRNATTMLPLSTIKSKAVGRLSGHAWEQIELAAACRGNLLFTPAGGAPFIHDQHVMTIPDAAVFAAATGYSWKYSSWYRLSFRRMGKKAQRILTFSDFSKRELERWCAIPFTKISITSLGCEHILRAAPDQSILEKHGLLQRRFVLGVASLNPNKNLDGIAKAIHLLSSQQLTFVLAGGVNSKVFGHHGSLPDNVIRLGFVSDAQLRALYQRALCFIFPSFYEGFGLPPLEAMACGCPVVVSRAASFQEVCADAAAYCDPNDPIDIAQKIEGMVNETGQRRSFIERGKIRAGRFTWERTAKDTWDVLRRVIAALQH